MLKILRNEVVAEGPPPARLRVFRAALGLSEVRLAELAGITPQTVSRIERGHNLRSAGTAHAIATVIGVETGDLFDTIWDD